MDCWKEDGLRTENCLEEGEVRRVVDYQADHLWACMLAGSVEPRCLHCQEHRKGYSRDILVVGRDCSFADLEALARELR